MNNHGNILTFAGILMIGSVLFLSACNECNNNDTACIAERESAAALAALKDAKNCVPVLVSVAEDGTKLWKVSYSCSKVGGYNVFFSTKGTQTTERRGKFSTQKIVPNTEK
jgi:hypothetical protein